MTYMGGSVALLATDRNAWHGRADSAWGSSRIWNTGSSFETDLSNMTTDRNTWHTRADSAWGASRVWNSGESWEAAYNRVLPPAAGAYIDGTVINSSFGGTYTEMLRVTVNRTGYWGAGCYIQVDSGDEGGGFGWQIDIRYNGVSAGSISHGAEAGSKDYGGGHFSVPTFITSGQTISMWCAKGYSQSAHAARQGLRAYYLPVQAYPH